MMYIGIALSVLLVAIHCVEAEDVVNTLAESNQFTAGNTKCRGNDVCRNQQNKNYHWCYTDYSDNWDYCCTSQCVYAGATYLWCQSGAWWQYCGHNGTTDIQGRPCIKTAPCGVHKNDLISSNKYYWCYVDLNGNWDFCCAPHSKCKDISDSYGWCYIDASKEIYVRKTCKQME
ncbi:hypothetical protein ACJMK2_021544 [Sinanodonta woodiana]|uniref:Uncharacterized protein n=1 Tax=Sinanodonta woodiana TaxID=1069815 RepID=A0ABD3TGE8_SINWO